jgi:HlyD family secretion protein
MKRWLTWLIGATLLAAAAWGGWWWWSGREQGAAGSEYRTVPVKRSTVVQSISATGTLVPEDVIDVGAQVNGPIASFGTDTQGRVVDYRSEVTAGSVLARIDEAVYAADVAADEARLKQAEAQVRVAEANTVQARARLEQARRDWERAQRLGESRALSRAAFDASRSAFEQAEASLAVAESGIVEARAMVAMAEASLKRSRRNLAFCTITSPVDGVIIDRRVEIGQTVVASLNAPSLFLIAKDLRRMKVLVQVNEADIGSVRVGEPVTFTVDAFPDDRFSGVVRKVRLNAMMTQNVVTYTVEIETANADLRLLPYLTANVRFEIARAENTLAVPNSALRWSPPAPPTPAAPPTSAATARGGAGPNAAGGRGAGAQGQGPAVWVLGDGGLRRIEVTPGVSDGTTTAVAAEALAEGDMVVVGEASSGQRAAGGGTGSPFAPPMMGGRGGGGGRPR